MKEKFVLKCNFLKLIILLFFIPSLAFATVNITKFRNYSNNGKNYSVFYLTGNVDFNFFLVSAPSRIVVNLRNTRLKTALKMYSRDVIKNILNSYNGNKLKLTFYLKKSAKFRCYKYKINDHNYRLVLVLYHQNNYSDHLRNIIVVIDPGHGGKDPGATGSRGTYEKNVMLAIAKFLKQDLDTQRGFSARLTRSADKYIRLRHRLSIARKYKADMFISIHADIYKNSKISGASIYALSERGATSEAARWVAKKENKSELGNILENKNKSLRSVLINLAQTASIRKSLKIGNSILGQLKKVTKLHDKSVEQAAFIVLKEPDVPSLLVEVGFLSNKREELKLRSKYYQKKIAYSLMLGIKKYFTKHPVVGTYLYANKNTR